MNISIVYATYSNSTLLASEVLKNALTAQGHVVSLHTAADATSEALTTPELLILASPSWDYDGQQGMPHEDFAALQQRVGAVGLNGKPTAVLALGDSSFTYFCGAADHLTEWLKTNGASEAAAPLKIDQYYADEVGAQKLIADWATTLMTATANQ
jgi:flavodoxin